MSSFVGSSAADSLEAVPVRGHRAEVRIVEASSVAQLGADAVMVPLFAHSEGSDSSYANGADSFSIGALPSELSIDDAALLQALNAVNASGRRGSTTVVPAPQGAAVARVVTVGLGSEDLKPAQVSDVIAEAVRNLRGVSTLAVATGDLDVEAALLGAGLGSYFYDGLKNSPSNPSPVRQVAAIIEASDDSTDAALKRASILIDSICLARDLVNSPSNALYPEKYALFAAEQAREAGCEVEVLDYEQLVEQGFGGIVGVGRGSARKPRLVRISWKPEAAKKHVALVGKGITFDTGGISIKPSANMQAMISDMGGSAAMIASTIAAARLGLKVQVTATIPMAENMPSGDSYRPGDTLVQYGGKTVEIVNTDAEGRLILADAIARACEDNPDYLIETATLTGSALVALGRRTAGVMGEETFRDRIAEIGREVGEPAWAMPITEEIAEGMKSKVADLVNSGSRWGGMMAAGFFLGEFVSEGTPWAHIDVAGPAWNEASPYGVNPARATGAPVRTVVAAIEELESAT